MINVYLGKPGAGKSYSAMDLLLSALAAGRRVYTTLPVVRDAAQVEVTRRRRAANAKRIGSSGLVRKLLFRPMRLVAFVRLCRMARRKFAGWQAPMLLTMLDVKRLPDGYYWEELVRNAEVGIDGRGPVFIVDEIGSVLDKMRTSEQSANRFMQTMREHRHFYASIVFIVQAHHQLDGLAGLKPMVGHWCFVANVKHTIGLAMYDRVVYDTHLPRMLTEPVSRKRGFFRQRIFNCYRSHALGAARVGARRVKQDGTEAEETEYGSEQEVTMGTSRRGRIMVVLVLCVCAVVGGLYFGGTLFSKAAMMVSGESPEVSVGFAGEEKPAAVVSPAPDARPEIDESWAFDSFARLRRKFPSMDITRETVLNGKYLRAGRWFAVPGRCEHAKMPGGDFLVCAPRQAPESAGG